MKPKWKPTHEITCGINSWIVMLYDGNGYTDSIWYRGGEPEWVATGESRFAYVGGPWKPTGRLVVRDLQPRPRYTPDAKELDDPHLARLRDHATRLRRAIQKVGSHPKAPGMSHFPTNCCDHACALLALFFHDAHLAAFDSVCGEYDDDDRHRWLENGRVIVDITADQFDEGLPPVIVTRESAWHNAWKAKRTRPAGGHEAYLTGIRAYYQPYYERILAELPKC